MRIGAALAHLGKPGPVRYRMRTAPLFVNCCHCLWCQRETGASFALNAMIEAEFAWQTQRLAALAGPFLSHT